MINPIKNDPVPLREDASGTLRVGETRVLLELLLNAFDDGETPETIVQQYPTLKLSDVYSVIAYYLRHREELEDYLRRREAQATEVRQRIEAGQSDLSGIRQRLLGRRTLARQIDAPPGE